jgi:CDP-diacylglycerol pyrophosphatase
MADDKRKLTEKELKRKNDFEKISSEMQQKGYKMKNVVINSYYSVIFLCQIVINTLHLEWNGL